MPQPAPEPPRRLILGLVGDNIDASNAPRLHGLAGGLCDIAVRYDRLVPPRLGQSLETVLEQAQAAGYRGLNITYPYKERAAALVQIPDPMVRAVGAVNTVLFGPGGPQGHNTDLTGFVAACRAGPAPPQGPVLLIGTGGVGRAIAFGLLDLGVPELRLCDQDPARAARLAADLARARPGLSLHLAADPVQGARGVQGVVNATPVGMVGHPGTVLPAAALPPGGWAFDAVYTPVQTTFLQEAAAAGLRVLSGWELFFWQGVHAWQHFSGQEVAPGPLRRALLAAT